MSWNRTDGSDSLPSSKRRYICSLLKHVCAVFLSNWVEHEQLYVVSAYLYYHPPSEEDLGPNVYQNDSSKEIYDLLFKGTRYSFLPTTDLLSAMRQLMCTGSRGEHHMENKKDVTRYCREWRVCNYLIFCVVNSILDYAGPRGVHTGLAEAWDSLKPILCWQESSRKSIGNYRHGMIMWDTKRLASSRLRESFWAYRCMARLCGEHDPTKRPAEVKKNKEILLRIFKDALRSDTLENARPESQAIAVGVPAVCPDTISEELCEMKKTLTMMGGLSLGPRKSTNRNPKLEDRGLLRRTIR
ncbi:hypothetical protein BO78DRAFT_434335 [Aspergillus sclerotiicarbonarius CBS 121057]|uniref:Uncharacterized protein n=1 Tax=Aspergillus sclerotiicarbonarius (strain CBS 121057 / IBT 28362) TaxID=1448318 RepID=A0A319E217_ASPSB|nr:hypothetical protein BO78DRAFT_434335 [Aspergillus sclerotiicarbonarius CBS 121057]